jgi:hemoglobin-like flavoprotein
MKIDESIQVILTREKVVADLFYMTFLDRYPAVQQFFVNVDMQQQNVLLTMGLFIAEQYYRFQYPAMKHYLQLLGHKHCLRKVPAEMYADWRDCLVETLRQFHGGAWTTDLEAEWNAAIDLASQIMLQGYPAPLKFE